MPETSTLKNHFLLSMPHLQSDFFSASLIYLCEHNDEGAIGLVINKPTELKLRAVLEQLELAIAETANLDAPVYIGGPVSDDRGFLLHTADAKVRKSTLEINSELSLTTSVDILEEIALGKGPEQFLFTLGYSGWAAGQLEDEIKQNLWLSCPATLDILFAKDPTEKLSSAAAQIGIDLNLLSAQAGHA